MLKANQTAQVQFTGYTAQGEGVCRVDGCTVFVPNALRGEICEITVRHVGKTQAHGTISRLMERSPHRVSRGCPYAKRCGGCQLWHMDYGEELRFKAQKVMDALNRIGGQKLENLTITGGDGKSTSLFQLMAENDIQSKDNISERSNLSAARPEIPLYYRNKAQFPMAQAWGKPVAGFYQQHTHDVVPIQECKIQNQTADQVRKLILNWAEQYKIPAYQETEHTGLLRHIFVRRAAVTSQVMVALVTNGERIPHEAELISRLQWGVPGLTSLIQSVNREKTNVVLGQKERVLWGRDYIEDQLCGFTFRLSLRSFYQVNHDQAQRLYEAAIRLADLHGTETVLDLYCGTGTITLALSRQAGRVIGVEVVPEAIEDAKKNATQNHVENVEFFCADAGEAAARFAANAFPLKERAAAPNETAPGQPSPSGNAAPRENTGPDVIVVDPPRKGLAPEVIDAMVQMSPSRIVYVSCDPATLARDVKLLTAQGYTLTQAEAFDLFPRTFHVETVVSLSQLKSEV